VNGEGPNRASNPDNRMAYFARRRGHAVKGLDVGGAFEGYSDSAAVNAQGIYRAARWTGGAGVHRRARSADRDSHEGLYALARYDVLPQRSSWSAASSDSIRAIASASDRSTGYLLACSTSCGATRSR